MTGSEKREGDQKGEKREREGEEIQIRAASPSERLEM